MKRLALLFVLSLACVANGAVGDLNIFGLEAVNVIGLDGIGNAQGGNMLNVAQSSQSTDGYTIALGEQTGILAQVGVVVGAGGSAGIAQGAETGAMQGQIATPNIQLQMQGTETGMGQIIGAGNGAGAAGSQMAIDAQTQGLMSPGQASVQSQWTGVAQNGSVVAAPCSSGMVVNEASVCAEQLSGNVDPCPEDPCPPEPPCNPGC